MKILYFTSGPRHRVLQKLLDEGEEIRGIVTPTPKQSCRFKETLEIADKYEISLYHPKKSEIYTTVVDLGADIFLSVGYSYLFTPEVINCPKYCVNSHPTLLPKYRGARSGNYILIHGEKETGVTVHFIDEGMDTGDIILQRFYPLSIFDTAMSMKRKTLEFEPDVVYEAIQMIKSGHPPRIPQDSSKTSHYPDRTPEDSEIDWNKPLRELYNEIRACNPNDYPAFFYAEGEKVCIRLWRPEKPDDEFDLI